ERREETLRAMIRDGYLDAERHQGRIHVAGRSWHAWAQPRPVLPVSLRERLAAMRLRSCDESTGAIQATRVVDVWETGVRPVFRGRLDNRYEIRVTRGQPC